MSKKVTPILEGSKIVAYSFKCPGCKSNHHFQVVGNPVWAFKGTEEKPTFRPSLVVEWPGLPKRCHLWVTDGVIEFLSDCSHELAGKKVEMLDVES